jgi:hypothetical protein
MAVANPIPVLVPVTNAIPMRFSFSCFPAPSPGRTTALPKKPVPGERGIDAMQRSLLDQKAVSPASWDIARSGRNSVAKDRLVAFVPAALIRLAHAISLALLLFVFSFFNYFITCADKNK